MQLSRAGSIAARSTPTIILPEQHRRHDITRASGSAADVRHTQPGRRAEIVRWAIEQSCTATHHGPQCSGAEPNDLSMSPSTARCPGLASLPTCVVVYRSVARHLAIVARPCGVGCELLPWREAHDYGLAPHGAMARCHAPSRRVCGDGVMV